MSVRRWLLFGATLALPLVAACGGSSPVLSKVFKAPVWQGTEQFSYDLVDEGGNVYGACVLETLPEVEPGKTQLSQLCGSGGPERDDRAVTVDSVTLRPASAVRTIADPSKDKRTTFTSAYDAAAGLVHFKADENGKVHEANRDLPKATKESPDPGYYDDESLFWLVRGVPREKGFEGSYADVNASSGQVVTATVSVQDKEQVKVPAGSFMAWRVRLQTSSITQYFWINDAAPHEVVQARIERASYQLAPPK